MGKNLILTISLLFVSFSVNAECIYIKDEPYIEYIKYLEEGRCVVFEKTEREIKEIPVDEKIEQYMIDNFTYQNEDEEYWKTPSETLRDKGGDCEDFAFFVQEELKKHNIESDVLAIYWKEEGDLTGHAITIYREDENINYFSNQYLYKTNHKTIKELLNNRYEKWTHYDFIFVDKSFGKRVENLK